jgi:hypothetical protein
MQCGVWRPEPSLATGLFVFDPKKSGDRQVLPKTLMAHFRELQSTLAPFKVCQ